MVYFKKHLSAAKYGLPFHSERINTIVYTILLHKVQDLSNLFLLNLALSHYSPKLKRLALVILQLALLLD